MRRRRRILSEFFLIYQRWISPLFPFRCRFYPTCSQYALECLEGKKFFQGMFLVLKRLLRCHPYHPGGFDPVP